MDIIQEIHVHMRTRNTCTVHEQVHTNYMYNNVQYMYRKVYSRNFLPLILIVFPIPRSFGDNHSLTSSSDISNTDDGKSATNKKINLLILY